MKPHSIISSICLALFLIFSGPAAKGQCTGVSVSDSLQLVNFYNLHGGPDWEANDGWLTEPVSEWQGVSLTDDNCHVEKLVKGDVIGDVYDFQLPYLTTLSLRSAEESSGSMIDFTGIPECTFLSLSKFQFNAPLVDFSNLPNLESISVQESGLTGPLPSLSGCPALTHVNLQNNQIDGPLPGFASNNLLGLNLGDNELSGTIPDFSDAHPLLQQCLLFGNNLSGSIPNFTNLAELTTLTLSRNQLTGSIPNFNLPSLTWLELTDNQLTGQIPPLDLPNLSLLRLGMNQLTGTLPSFDGMPTLNTLVVCPNDLVGAPLTFGTAPPNLELSSVVFDCIDGAEVSGFVFHDANGNCVMDEGENPIGGATVYANGGIYQVMTDNTGRYQMKFDIGNQTLFPQLPNELWGYTCPDLLPVELTTVSYDDMIDGVNFPLTILEECTRMSVDVNSFRTRPCMNTGVTVDYCNQGTIIAPNSYVDVVIPAGNEVTSTTIPYEALGGDVLRFQLGDLQAGQCGQILILVDISCLAPIGSFVCFEASIYPNEPCEAPAPLWDGSDIDVRGVCQGDAILFEITNRGAAMQSPNIYSCYEDDILSNLDIYFLGEGETVEFTMPANGKSHRMRAECNVGNPYREFAQDIVESCGPIPHSLGFVNSTSNGHLSRVYDEFCSEITAAYDPNDKTVFPAGVGEARYISPEQELQYRIRFQNTGNDTAFVVQLVDVIDANYLDISTIQTRSASHSFVLERNGNTATWTFDNILLPDSSTNLMGSQGYVEFSIRQKEANPDGAIIANYVDIFFDSNEAVRTNTTSNTVCSDFEFLGLDALVNLQNSSMMQTVMAEGEQATLLAEFLLESPTISLDSYEVSQEGNNFMIDVKFVNQGIGCAPTQTSVSEFFDLGSLPVGSYTVSLDHNLTANEIQESYTFEVYPNSPTLVNISGDDTFCIPAAGLTLAATGESLQWYQDPELSIILGEGEQVLVPAGTSQVYLTQTVSGLESQPLQLDFIASTMPSLTAIPPLCNADLPPSLPTPMNGSESIPGTWYPAVVDMNQTGESIYLFEPDEDCFETVQLSIEVNAAPVLQSTPYLSTCQGESLDFPEVTVSGQQITGSWSSSSIDVQQTGLNTYSFLADMLCAEPLELQVEVIEASAVQLSEFPTSICQTDELPTLPEASLEGLTGTWSPAVIDAETTGLSTYTFTPSDNCALEKTVEIEIISSVQPTINLPREICIGATVNLPLQSNDDSPINGSWQPALVETQIAGIYEYTFTPDTEYCAEAITLSMEVIQHEIELSFVDGVLAVSSESDLSYDWYQGDELVAQGASFIPQQDGFYFVQASDMFGCTVNSELLEVSVSVGIDNHADASLEVYPNPGSSIVNISLPMDEISHLQILDVQGRMIKEFSSLGSTELDVSSWPTGLYLLQVHSGKRQFYERLIIE